MEELWILCSYQGIPLKVMEYLLLQKTAPHVPCIYLLSLAYFQGIAVLRDHSQIMSATKGLGGGVGKCLQSLTKGRKGGQANADNI